MLASVFVKKGVFEIREFDMPKINDTHVIVKVERGDVDAVFDASDPELLKNLMASTEGIPFDVSLECCGYACAQGNLHEGFYGVYS